MRYLFVLALFVGLVGCSSNPGQIGGSNETTVAVPDFEDLELGDPIEQGGLTLVPVSSKSSVPDTDDYVTLAEAKENKWIEIVEVPGQESVSTLTVRYSGPKPMILLAGELLLGGKQDRVVAKDTIIQPGESAAVAVYCVEPERWSGTSMHFEAEAAQVPLAVKEKAIFGSQQEVWDSVGGYNAEVSSIAGVPVEGSSLKGGYRAVTNSKEYAESLKKALSEIRGRKNVIGVVIVLNGKIHSFEYFQSPRLFESSAESVLRGALASAMVEKGKGGKPAMSDVADFVARSLKSMQSRSLRQASGFVNLDDGLDVGGAAMMRPGDSAGSDNAVVHGTFYEQKK